MDDQQCKQVDKYIVTGKLLGKGSFGTVYRGFFKEDQNKVVAVKVIPIENIGNDKKFIELLKREIEIMTKIKHSNIVRMYSAMRTPRNLYMFLEYCPDGDIKSLLKQRNGHLSEAEAVIFFRQIVDGFKTLYQNSIIHRDIKPANVLLKDGVAKITDFGFARIVESGMEDITALTKVGTPLYMSPQILADQKFSSKCDIWSLGMMLYEMLYGKTPWNASTPVQLYNNILKIPLEFPKKPVRSQLIKDLLRLMLVIEDKDRVSWTELFAHPVIQAEELGIQENMAKINEEMDPLLKSVALNKLYLSNNRVLGPKKNPAEIKKIKKEHQVQKPKTSEAQSHPRKKVVYDEKTDVNKVLEKQDEDQNSKKVIAEVDSYMTYQRNIAIFINFTSTQFFNYCNGNKSLLIELSPADFFTIFFLFQKYQIMIFKEILIQMDSKDHAFFTNESWELYKQSGEFAVTYLAIKNDRDFMLPYYNEVLKRTQTAIDKQLERGDEKWGKKFKTIEPLLKKNFDDIDTFQRIYLETMKDFINNEIKPVLFKKDIQMEKKYLLVVRFIITCMDPFTEFKFDNTDASQNTDFHKFYENYENIDEEVLLKELKDLLA